MRLCYILGANSFSHVRHCWSEVVLRLNSSESSGTGIVLTGVALLVITFVIAGIHLYGGINVLPVPSFFAAFGEFLSPLIEAAIRILYLGVMVWIASTVTTKGLNLLLQTRLAIKNNQQSKE